MKTDGRACASSKTSVLAKWQGGVALMLDVVLKCMFDEGCCKLLNVGQNVLPQVKIQSVVARLI